ncbi:hypothetical protein SLEP1_g24318 [Rubroshorea leprosula]|uniref:Uncharacterized protein n=1 Tax=Rubroshorea leprosula TaxID=152421 RepID=A0AAV5JLB2_9ROSI|nr:hypothetical protein SLEP1_g24318 [Rubroshorea leprosula]
MMQILWTRVSDPASSPEVDEQSLGCLSTLRESVFFFHQTQFSFLFKNLGSIVF